MDKQSSSEYQAVKTDNAHLTKWACGMHKAAVYSINQIHGKWLWINYPVLPHNQRQTFVTSESVARRLRAPRWLPNTPPITVLPNGEWTDLKISTVAMDPSPSSRVRCTHPIQIQWNWTREWCSAPTFQNYISWNKL